MGFLRGGGRGGVTRDRLALMRYIKQKGSRVALGRIVESNAFIANRSSGHPPFPPPSSHSAYP